MSRPARPRRLLPLALLALLLAPGAAAQDKVATTAAQFLSLGVGSRGTAMGSAHVASVEGPSGVYWNPAAIAWMTTSGAEFSQSAWLVGSRLQHAAVVLHLGAAGRLGFSLTSLAYGETEVTTIERPDGTGQMWDASDLALGVTFARTLTDRFSVGGTVKYVRQQIWNESAEGAAIDLGVVYETGVRGIRLAASMANFGTDMRLAGPDLRRAIDIAPGQAGSNPRLGANLEVDAWPMPLVFRVGLAGTPIATRDHRLLVTLDGNAPSDQAQSASFGAEYAFRDLVFLRAGWRQAFGYRGDDGWTAGFGLRYRLDQRIAGSFDYSFQHVEPFGTPQMFTLGLTF